MIMKPLIVCSSCGRRWMPTRRETRGITVSLGECDVCGKQDWISPAYDYGWTNEAYSEAKFERAQRMLIPATLGEAEAK